MLLRQMLNNASEPLFQIDDREYRLYLQDHKQSILETCEKVKLSPSEQAVYEYRPRYFLYDRGYRPTMEWIFLWVNDMTDASQFSNREYVLVPDYRRIENLYSTYRTLRTRYKTASTKLIST